MKTDKKYKNIIVSEKEEYEQFNVYYYDKTKNSFQLLKKKGITLSTLCGLEERKNLYYYIPEKLEEIVLINKILIKDLTHEIKKENIVKVKEIITKVINNNFSEPRNGSLKGVNKIIYIIIDEYFGHYAVLTNLARLNTKDYTTIIHSINVMSYVLSYCFFMNFNKDKTYNYGLSALLHDIGKIEISDDILKADRTLNPSEYEEIKKHPLIGLDILKDYDFPKDVIDGCIQHHERLDGSGYPYGLKENKITEISRILAIIDPYEAITSIERPYRKKISNEEALEIIYNEKNKIDDKIFTNFIKNLGVLIKAS